MFLVEEAYIGIACLPIQLCNEIRLNQIKSNYCKILFKHFKVFARIVYFLQRDLYENNLYLKKCTLIIDSFVAIHVFFSNSKGEFFIRFKCDQT